MFVATMGYENILMPFFNVAEEKPAWTTTPWDRADHPMFEEASNRHRNTEQALHVRYHCHVLFSGGKFPLL